MTYKKVNTTRIEQIVYQQNKDLTNDSTFFRVVAPVNSICIGKYMNNLTNAFRDGDSILTLKNSFHIAGEYHPDWNNNYRIYEITKSYLEDGHIWLSYQLAP